MLGRKDRFDFQRTTRDATGSYPEILRELKLRYPSYDLIWDRQKSRWLCVTRLGPEKLRAVSYLENNDGTPAEPSMRFIEKLQKSDWVRHFDTPNKVIDALEREERDAQEKLEAGIRREMELVRASLRGHFERDPASVEVVLRPFDAGWRDEVERDLSASAGLRSGDATDS